MAVKKAFSALWVIVDTGGAALISMGSILFIARLLGPEEFGIAAVAIGIVQVANLFAEGLLHDALVQHRSADERCFREAFWASLGSGTALLAVFCTAAFLLNNTAVSRIAMMAATAAVSLPLTAMIGVSNARLRRTMQFNVVARASISARLIGAITGVLLAWAGMGPVALVIQLILTALLNIILQTLQSQWLPKPTGQFKQLKQLWRFALPYAFMHTIVGGRIQGFLAITATISSVATAGVISAALRLTLTPQLLVTTAITNYVLPVLARTQDDRPQAIAAYLELTKYVALFCVPLFAGLASVADPLVRVMLGSSWIEAIVPLKIFAAAAALYTARSTGGIFLRSLGFVRFSFMNAIAHAFLTLGGIVILRPESAASVSWFWLMPALALLPITWIVLSKTASISVSEQIKALLPACLASAAIMLVVTQVDSYFTFDSQLMQLSVLIATGASAFALVALAVEPRFRKILLFSRRRIS